MTVLVIEPGKTPVLREIDGSLEAIQGIVGGLIQAIYPFEEPVALVCNDEGKLLGLPPNREVFDQGSGKILDIISGTFFICGAPPDAEDFASLTDEQAARYERMFHSPEYFLRIGGQLVVVRGLV